MPDASSSPVKPKAEDSREPSLGSGSSSIDGEAEHIYPDETQEEHISLPQEPQVQKRKGGRKPIYATSEERKQRNRQAQAAFRERRTEYIKQLETTIKKQDETLQNLQHNHRSAADECLMLRYKNSLLERILLEKGIDVQAELKKKEITIPTKVPPSLPQPTPIQRAAMNRRHQYSRSGSGSSYLPGSETNNTVGRSPHTQRSPSTASASPSSARCRPYSSHGLMRPSAAGFKAPPPPLRVTGTQPTSPGPATAMQALTTSPVSQPNSAGVGRPNHWPSPFETHMQQLEQEYGAHSDIMDEPEGEEPVRGPGPYLEEYSRGQDLSPKGRPHGQFNGRVVSNGGEPGHLPLGPEGQNVNHLSIDPFDPMLDADPFGLTASMHFPTQFSFQESSMRK